MRRGTGGPLLPSKWGLRVPLKGEPRAYRRIPIKKINIEVLRFFPQKTNYRYTYSLIEKKERKPSTGRKRMTGNYETDATKERT